MSELKGACLGISWRLWQMMPTGGRTSWWGIWKSMKVPHHGHCYRSSPFTEHCTHTLEYPVSWLCLWMHDGWAIISQWPKTTCFSLCSNCALFQGERFPVETREPSCVWVFQTVSRFLSDGLVNGKNTALSRSLLPLTHIQLPLIINVYWIPIICNEIQ